MNSIAFITAADAGIASRLISQFKPFKLIALDYSAHLILKTNRIDHVALDDFILYDEYGEIDSLAHTIPQIWSKFDTDQALLHEQINLGEVLEWEMVYAIVKFLRLFYGINRAISTIRPDNVIVHKQDDYVSKIVRQVCDNLGLQVTAIEGDHTVDSLFWLDNISVTLDLFGRPTTITVSRDTYQRIKSVVDSIGRMISKFNSVNKNKTNRILLLEFNLANYKLLIESLQERKIDVILLNQRRPIIWNTSSFRIFKELHLEYNFLKQYATSSLEAMIFDRTKRINSTLEECSSSAYFSDLFSFKGSTFWPAFRDDFINFCKKRLAEAVRETSFGNAALDKEKPDSLLVWSDHSQFEKTMVLLAKRRGIPTFVIQHGMLGNILRNGKSVWASQDNKRIYADYYCCWGKITRDWYIKQGIDPSKLVLTGSPRYDAYFKTTAHTAEDILLATSGIPSNTFSIFSSIKQIEEYEKKIRSICRTAKRFSQRFVVKLHPYADEGFDIIKAIKEENSDAIIVKNVSIIDALNRSSIVISTGSSVLLEAMLLNKPTIMLRYINGVEQQEVSYSEFGASVGTDGDEDSIYSAIYKILHDKEFRNNLIRRGREYTEQYLEYRGNSTQRIADIATRESKPT